MRLIQQVIHGRLDEPEPAFTVLILDSTAPPLYLRYLIRELDRETGIFPATLLDDWGKERRGLELYDWLRENGGRFPRAEIFGLDLQGNQSQAFLRELELFTRHPCYAAAEANGPPPATRLVTAVVVPDETAASPERTRPPAVVEGPLNSARVGWWRAHAATTDFTFAVDPNTSP